MFEFQLKISCCGKGPGNLDQAGGKRDIQYIHKYKIDVFYHMICIYLLYSIYGVVYQLTFFPCIFTRQSLGQTCIFSDFTCNFARPFKDSSFQHLGGGYQLRGDFMAGWAPRAGLRRLAPQCIVSSISFVDERLTIMNESQGWRVICVYGSGRIS